MNIINGLNQEHSIIFWHTLFSEQLDEHGIPIKQVKPQAIVPSGGTIQSINAKIEQFHQEQLQVMFTIYLCSI